MLALVTNHMDDNLHLGLRLVQVGAEVAWQNIETEALHGPTYGSIAGAVRGLRRQHGGAGSEVTFMPKANTRPAGAPRAA